MGLFNSKKKNDQQNQQMYNQMAGMNPMGGNPMMPPQQGYGQPNQAPYPQGGMGPMPSQQGSVNPGMQMVVADPNMSAMPAQYGGPAGMNNAQDLMNFINVLAEQREKEREESKLLVAGNYVLLAVLGIILGVSLGFLMYFIYTLAVI